MMRMPPSLLIGLLATFFLVAREEDGCHSPFEPPPAIEFDCYDIRLLKMMAHDYPLDETTPLYFAASRRLLSAGTLPATSSSRIDRRRPDSGPSSSCSSVGQNPREFPSPCSSFLPPQPGQAPIESLASWTNLRFGRHG